MGRYVAELEDDLRRQQRYAIVVDVRRLGKVTSEHRKTLSDWADAHRALLSSYRAGFAMVSTSAAQRGLLVASYFVQRPPYPFKVFDTLGKATAWARGQVRGGGT